MLLPTGHNASEINEPLRYFHRPIWGGVSLELKEEIQREQNAFKDASALEHETHNSGTVFSNISKLE